MSAEEKIALAIEYINSLESYGVDRDICECVRREILKRLGDDESKKSYQIRKGKKR